MRREGAERELMVGRKRGAGKELDLGGRLDKGLDLEGAGVLEEGVGGEGGGGFLGDLTGRGRRGCDAGALGAGRIAFYCCLRAMLRPRWGRLIVPHELVIMFINAAVAAAAACPFPLHPRPTTRARRLLRSPARPPPTPR